MRFIIGLVLGVFIGFGIALWFQGEPPFAGTATTGSHGVTLLLSDGFLTRAASPQIIARSAGALTDVKVSSSQGDTAYVEATGTAAGVSVPVGVSFSPEVVGGSISLKVQSVHLGPLPVPSVVIDPLVSVINNRIASLIDESNYEITGTGTTKSGVEIFIRQR